MSVGTMRTTLAIACGIFFVSVFASAQAVHDEAAFLSENDAAMSKMMRGMTIRPSGNADVDFAAMMIPHHQGAIDMAIA